MKSRLLLPFLTAATSLLVTVPTQAEVKLSALFSDHLVLQSGKAVPVWGWAEPGEEVTVSIGSQRKVVKTDPSGFWRVQFDALEASSEPATLTAKGSNTVTANDVLIGEVWLGSGQSNMAMLVSKAKDFDQEKTASNLPHVRMFVVNGTFASEAAKDPVGSWVVCSPETVGAFSATAFFFGREIHKQLKVPVGLINSSVGGTPIDAWISPEAQKASAELKPLFASLELEGAALDQTAPKAAYEKQLAEWPEAVKKAKAAGKPAPRKPQDPIALRARKNSVGGLFNGKIAALIPFGLRGILWYQGEANAGSIKAPYYQYHLPLLVTDWRARWGEELPFAWVQLPNYSSRGDGWCLVREAMLKTLKLPKTGMAITLDVGDAKNIHPKNKQDVGKRLAAWALGTVYDKKVETSGPLPKKHEVKDNSVIVSFSHADGLMAKGGELKEFVIAGEDQQWQPAKARIEDGKVIVSSEAVPKPVAARYAWKDNPEATLFNGAGIPATQFRTDDWPIKMPDTLAERKRDFAEKAAARAKTKGKGKTTPEAKAGKEAVPEAKPVPKA